MKPNTAPQEAHEKFVSFLQAHEPQKAWAYCYDQYKGFVKFIFKTNYSLMLETDETLRLESLVDDVFTELHTMIEDQSINEMLGIPKAQGWLKTFSSWYVSLEKTFAKKQKVPILKDVIANLAYKLGASLSRKVKRTARKMYHAPTETEDSPYPHEPQAEITDSPTYWAEIAEKEQYKHAFLESLKTKNGKETNQYLVAKALLNLEDDYTSKKLYERLQQELALLGVAEDIGNLHQYVKNIREKANTFFKNLMVLLIIAFYFLTV